MGQGFLFHHQGRGSMGEELFNEVTSATGLPKDVVSDELNRLLAQSGLTKDDMTLDDLRHVLAEYVQDILLNAKHEFSEKKAVGE
jgi:hypothetical protein